MEDRKILKLVYTLFLGVLVALFVGVGINTFYPGPKAPEYPVSLNTYGKEPTPQQAEAQRAWDQKMAVYDKQMQPYNRNVSMIAISAAVVLLVASLLLEERLKLLSDGMLVGGLLTLLYGLGRGFASQDTKYVFIAVTVGLVVALYVGYRQFLSKPKSSKAATPTGHIES